MNILVLGSGGREHAIIWSLNKSPKTQKIFCSPGNGGIAQIAECVDIKQSDIVSFCRSNNIELVVIGPEAPLVEGVADNLRNNDILVFGPNQKAAQLEGSKTFMKDLCSKYDIATAKYGSFNNLKDAQEYLARQELPIVIKADGLAAGKGVIIAQDFKEANEALEEIFDGKFGDAGNKVVIEEFLEGEEISFFTLVSNSQAMAFGSAQDHKRVGEGDTGPNTGGMGTYTPAPIMSDDLQAEIMNEIIMPTIEALGKEDCPYQGILFAGLMITKEGPKLLEYNVRFGDPETQSILARLKTDLVDLFLATAKGNLTGQKIEFDERAALCVVMAANGYPGSYQKGTEIKNIPNSDNVIIFHAGTKIENGKLLANGGRVLGVTALGKNVKEAQGEAYKAVDKIIWEDGFCRRDIGYRAIERENA